MTNLPHGLYIIATPIGNIKDITIRALETLEQVDLILCEDTRITHKLLNYYKIDTPTKCYNDHSTEKDRNQIIQHIQNQQAIALVSDAGTPLISDPGYKLVRQLHEHNLPITSLPGASAAITALTLSGLPTDRFIFLGFMPSKQKARINLLNEVKDSNATLITYETSPRLLTTLEDIKTHLGENREISISRELTKKFEEVKLGNAESIINYYNQPDHPLKGEIVITIAPPHPKEWNNETLAALITETLENHSLKETVKIITEQTGINRNTVYEKALKLKP